MDVKLNVEYNQTINETFWQYRSKNINNSVKETFTKIRTVVNFLDIIVRVNNGSTTTKIITLHENDTEKIHPILIDFILFNEGNDPELH